MNSCIKKSYSFIYYIELVFNYIILSGTIIFISILATIIKKLLF